ncbi:hypothetical protein [Endozoicomonas ascidiicola]|uniref:hypothetical protein n=1 Tax=Endozoicomonas ascidiicola TaxID=1698521 RepID=UPI0008341B16|nr:hypothetical protein [Endozoicomonas ascidiicola]
MKRLYYLTGSLNSVTQIIDDLHHAGISDWHLHVLSRNEAGLYHRQIHSANMLQENDVLHSGELGALIGGLAGLTIATLLELWDPFEFAASFPMLILVAGVFTLFGAWSGGLAGVTRENYKTERFHDELIRGRHLIMVDVSKQQEKVVRHHLSNYHPEASLAGEDTTLILPFSPNFWRYPRHN